jgi:hypothetical protein
VCITIKPCHFFLQNRVSAIKEANPEAEDDDDDDWIARDPTFISGYDYVGVCAVKQCNEEVFLACDKCNAFTCFQHISSTCVEHNKVLHPAAPGRPAAASGRPAAASGRPAAASGRPAAALASPAAAASGRAAAALASPAEALASPAAAASGRAAAALASPAAALASPAAAGSGRAAAALASPVAAASGRAAASSGRPAAALTSPEAGRQCRRAATAAAAALKSVCEAETQHPMEQNLDPDDNFQPSGIDSDDSDYEPTSSSSYLANLLNCEKVAATAATPVAPTTATTTATTATAATPVASTTATTAVTTATAATTATTPRSRPRKRLNTVAERSQRDVSNHPLRIPPMCNCRCNDKFAMNERSLMNYQYWSLTPDERRLWLRTTLSIQGCKRHRGVSPDARKNTIVWHLPKNGDRVKVCKTFFMAVLGMLRSSDKAIRFALFSGDPSSIQPPTDRRGQQPATNKGDEEQIREHIASYKPCAPHYRRAHAPHRRYLPTELSGAEMHRQYNELYPQAQVSHMSYRRVLATENIAFTPLGHEECELCTEHMYHLKVAGHDADDCTVCCRHAEHHQRYINAREEYVKDANRDWEQGEVVVSADLMKVVVLPSLPHKICLFTSRLIAFNMTFALLKPEKKATTKRDRSAESGAQVAILWHEALAGRDGCDIVSVYWKWLLLQRDCLRLTIYADNCGAQNKQWALYTMLVYAVNSDLIKAKKITFKYLESGHTFMSADSLHHQCEHALRNKVVADYSDFRSALGSKMVILDMDVQDFAEWQSGVSRYQINSYAKRPLMTDISVAQFERGSNEMFFKFEFDERAFHRYTLFKRKFTISDLPPPCKTIPRGLSADKKKAILDNLCPLMHPSRRLFWEQIPSSDEVLDLCDDEQ